MSFLGLYHESFCQWVSAMSPFVSGSVPWVLLSVGQCHESFCQWVSAMGLFVSRSVP